MNVLDSVELGAGTWQWGDRKLWGYGEKYGEAEVRSAFLASLDAGVRLFDTAEAYGHGRSEKLIGRLLPRAAAPLLVATKFMPRPWRLFKYNLVFALKQSLRRLGLAEIDLYFVHFPDPPVAIETWMDALADVAEAGLARAVGVSNYDLAQTERACARLEKRGVPLAALQRHYSLFERGPERSGLVSFCRERKIRFIAWSPIEKGVLTGKYTPERPPPGERSSIYYSRARLAAAQPLVQSIRAIGEERGRSAAQVALNWCICKGALPIPGPKSAAQARDNAGALGWRLSAEEVAILDEASDRATPT